LLHDENDARTLEASLHPRVFSSLYIAMVRTGENTGALPEVLFRIAEYRVKQEEMFSRFRMALAYPALMAIVGFATVIFMLAFVMPRLTRIFVDMGQDLPLATRVLISISRNLQQWWFLIAIVIAAVIFSVKKQARTPSGELFFSALKLKMPVLGGFILKAELARFSRTLELLVKSGIPILKAIDIAIPVLQNVVIKEQLSRSYKELEQGGSFGKSLKNSKILPLFMSNLLIVGEESGKLDEVLREIAGSYERDTEDALKIMAALLEPLMILVMGLIVGFIVVAMLLPIFEISPLR
jgi:general secretion pathway protein F